MIRGYDQWKTASPDDDRPDDDFAYSDEEIEQEDLDDMNEIATTQKSEHPLAVLCNRLQENRAEIRNTLPPGITPEQIIRALRTSAILNPEILACTWQSIWSAVMQCCRAGLLPDGVEAAIIPYKSRAGFVPMYQGLMRSARRSGQIKSIHADVVRAGETCSYYIDETGPHFRHEPGDDFTAPIVKAYAMATTFDGGFYGAVMTIAEINKHKNMSRTRFEDKPWEKWPEEMAKKTAIIRLCKMLPNGRDIIPPEDEDADDTLQIEKTAVVERPRGAAAALDQFAPTPEGGFPSAGEESGDSEERDAVESVAPLDRVPVSADPDPGEAQPGDDDSRQRTIAYNRGRAARSAGHARKAIPPEYRTPERTREAVCWIAGHDGVPAPK
jgi:recombination protein RecT